MDKEILRRFTGDKATREAVLGFVRDCIDEVGLARMYKRESVEHIADAKILIEIAFDKLTELYAIPEQKRERINQAK